MNLLPWIAAVYALELVAGYSLDFLNLRHLAVQGRQVPPPFEGRLDQALLAKTTEYTLAKMRFHFFSSFAGNAAIVAFFFGGLLDHYHAWVISWNWPFIATGLVFFLLLSVGQTLASLPFEAYRTFKIETRFGFNTTTPGLWWLDAAKALALSVVLTGVLLAAAFWFVARFPAAWWFWLWVFYAAFTLFLMVISPYVIEPLFNKFTPLEENPLTRRIREVLGQAGIRVNRVFRMDASRRSRHTNAYFSGIGRVKRIVLYDTLLEKLSEDEIVAVLAHEAGHWKKKHVTKSLLTMLLGSLAVFYLGHRLLQGHGLVQAFGLERDGFFLRLILLGFLFSLAGFLLAPALHGLSRRREREADDFSRRLTGGGAHLASALVKLSLDNLSNLHPHPWYAFFHYSHPPVVGRIARLLQPRR